VLTVWDNLLARFPQNYVRSIIIIIIIMVVTCFSSHVQYIKRFADKFWPLRKAMSLRFMIVYPSLLFSGQPLLVFS
jgi:hypothetical protein